MELSPDFVNRLRSQIDHYFCDYNLQSGHYLRKKLQNPGYITVDELMTFKKVSLLSNHSTEIVERVLCSEEFNFAFYDPYSKRITRRQDKPFTFDSSFWRTKARLSVYLLYFPDEYDPSLIQQAIPGVVFVRLVKDIQKNILSGDESLRDLDESFNSFDLNDSGNKSSDSKDSANGKRKPHAILYFKDEESMNSIIKACGPNREFYFENNNKKCYIRPRREDISHSDSSPTNKSSQPTLYQVARARTMVWYSEIMDNKDQMKAVKDIFEPHGVIITFFITGYWLLFFKNNHDFRRFYEDLKLRKFDYEGKFIPLNDLESGDDLMLKNYSSYLKVLRNFYQKNHN